MKLKLPPALIMVFVIAMMLVIDRYIQVSLIAFEGHRTIADIFFWLGILWGLLGLWEFFKASTTIDPHSAERVSSIVQSGIYRISRNPMYIGLVCITIAAGFYVGNALTLIMVPVFVVYLQYLQIIPEEEALEEKFGDEFLQYKSKVRRWL